MRSRYPVKTKVPSITIPQQLVVISAERFLSPIRRIAKKNAPRLANPMLSFRQNAQIESIPAGSRALHLSERTKRRRKISSRPKSNMTRLCAKKGEPAAQLIRGRGRSWYHRFALEVIAINASKIRTPNSISAVSNKTVVEG
jgi:hypothetical protein